MTVRHALVLATKNQGKLSELRALLEGMPVDVLSLSDVRGDRITIIEDGATFEDNAIIKARAVSRVTSMLTLADDSGLEIDALDGAPGVRSARYAQTDPLSRRPSDADNTQAVLRALAAKPNAGSAARFRCVLALVDPYDDGGKPHTLHGTCEGMIITIPRGTNGFGYDPIFVPTGHTRTMAELSAAEKNALSHRGQALAQVRPLLERLIAARDASIRKIVR